LRMMAEATPSQRLREALAFWLMDLGDHDGADQVLGEVYAERNGLRPPRPEDQGRRWMTVLRATTMGPTELRHVEPGTETAEPARAFAGGRGPNDRSTWSRPGGWKDVRPRLPPRPHATPWATGDVRGSCALRRRSSRPRSGWRCWGWIGGGWM